MKVSIVIPVFNSKWLISDCLESLVNQTMSKEDYEIYVLLMINLYIHL